MSGGVVFWPWWRKRFKDNAVVAFGFCLVFCLIGRYNVPLWITLPAFTIPMAAYLSTMQWFLRRRDDPPPFLASILYFAVGYFSVFAFALLTGIYLSAWIGGMIDNHKWISPVNAGLISAMKGIVGSDVIHWTMGLGFLGMILTHFFFQINRKLGPGVLWQWISGKYHRPKAEERIVMFLDMRDSTTLAERLGDVRFSGLVKAFISDVSRAVQECKGEVSHFIGDEVVATWRPDRGFRDARCLRVVKRSNELIDRRRAYYERTFGLVPEFKAGMHIGPVVATEVGEAKSEIVLHGDAMNTAARIQGECNRYGEEFLVSQALLDRLGRPEGWRSTPIGDLELKGKQKPVPVVALREA